MLKTKNAMKTSLNQHEAKLYVYSDDSLPLFQQLVLTPSI